MDRVGPYSYTAIGTQRRYVPRFIRTDRSFSFSFRLRSPHTSLNFTTTSFEIRLPLSIFLHCLLARIWKLEARGMMHESLLLRKIGKIADTSTHSHTHAHTHMPSVMKSRTNASQTFLWRKNKTIFINGIESSCSRYRQTNKSIINQMMAKNVFGGRARTRSFTHVVSHEFSIEIGNFAVGRVQRQRWQLHASPLLRTSYCQTALSANFPFFFTFLSPFSSLHKLNSCLSFYFSQFLFIATRSPLPTQASVPHFRRMHFSAIRSDAIASARAYLPSMYVL